MSFLPEVVLETKLLNESARRSVGGDGVGRGDPKFASERAGPRTRTRRCRVHARGPPDRIARPMERICDPKWCSYDDPGDEAPGRGAARSARCDRGVRRRPQGPSGGDRRGRHGPTFDPHPLTVIHPEAAPKLIMPVRREAGCDRRARGGGAGGDPLRQGVHADLGGGVHLRDPARAGWERRRSRWERTSASGRRRRGPGDARRTTSSRRVVPLVEVDGETVSSTRVRALVAAGEVDAAMRCLGAPVHARGRGGRG